MRKSLVVGLGLLLTAGTANASSILYANSGAENASLYMFSAVTTGDIGAYFYGSDAGYTTEIGLLVNGVSTGITGLNNKTSAHGDYLNLGHAEAGDTLTFQLINLKNSAVDPWYSDATMNSDGINHIYSTDFAGDTLIPAGVFISFEDLRFGGDFDYNDQQFVVVNVVDPPPGKVPEPAPLALVLAGLVAMRHIVRRRQSLS